MKTVTRILATLSILLFGGCASQIDPAAIRQHQLLVHQMQSRTFETNDGNLVARGVISALQDLSFIINKADAEHGVISAKKFGTYPIEMTVTFQPVSETRILVHGNAVYDAKTIEDAALYQQFFSIVQKALKLTAHSAD